MANPEKTSTPYTVPKPQRRPAISQSFNMPSPIPIKSSDEENEQNRSCTIDQQPLNISKDSSCETNIPSISEDSSDTDTDNNKYLLKTPYQNKINRELIQQSPIKKENNMFTTLHIITLIFGICVCAALANLSCNSSYENVLTIDELKRSFPQQDEKFWIHIKSGVSEIENFNKPSVIIFVYENGMSSVTELLSNITTYASCILNEDCAVEPIVVSGKNLNTYEILKDHGVLIEKYRSLLEKRHIMVIENMEEILGPVAQALHYFCDEYSPLVKRSLIIFTVQVDEFKGRELEQVVNILENKWSDIEQDKLEPLITRVSSIVLRIK